MRIVSDRNPFVEIRHRRRARGRRRCLGRFGGVGGFAGRRPGPAALRASSTGAAPDAPPRPRRRASPGAGSSASARPPGWLERSALETAGARIVAPLPDQAFLVDVPPGRAIALSKHPGRGVGRAVPPAGQDRAGDRPGGRRAGQGSADLAVVVHLFADADPHAGRGRAGGVGAARRQRRVAADASAASCCSRRRRSCRGPRRGARGAERRVLDRPAVPPHAGQRQLDLGRPVRPQRRHDDADLRPRHLRRGPGRRGARHRPRRRHVLLPRRRAGAAADQHRRRHRRRPEPPQGARGRLPLGGRRPGEPRRLGQPGARDPRRRDAGRGQPGQPDPARHRRTAWRRRPSS